MRDISVETFFDNLGITEGKGITYVPEFDLSKINVTRSRANQARLEALEPNRVAQYEAAMKRGDIFPAIVVQAATGGEFDIRSGNHRQASLARLARTHHSAYVLDSSVEGAVVDEFMMYANSVHGSEITDEEKLMWVETFILRGRSHSEIARILNLTTSATTRYANIAKGNTRIRKAGLNYDQWEALSRTHRLRLNSQHIDDEVFVRLVKITFKLRPGTDRVDAIIKTINAATDRQERISAIDLWEQELKTSTRTAATGSTRNRSGNLQAAWASANRYIGGLDQLTPEQVVRSLTTVEQATRMSENVDSMVDFFINLRTLLNEQQTSKVK